MAKSRINILGPNGKPARTVAPKGVNGTNRIINAKYDAAQTTNENTRHWANADSLSARAANSPEVRLKLRNRSRYERDNNSYASGIVETIANDTIGTGPRLQVQTGDPEADEEIAESFDDWTNSVGLAEKLRTYREARAVDGEAFALFSTNPLLATPVKLDIRLIEADQVTSPWLFPIDLTSVDGIEFDAYGNPSAYHVLRHHPGDLMSRGWEYDTVPARLVLHWFKCRRPGQRRGIPELTPALPLFAMLRRYTLAALSAAEIAALFAALLKSTMPAEDTDEGINPFDTQEIVRGMMTALPDGYDVTQLKAEQPTTTYPDFKREVLNEIARCLCVPFNVAAGNSSGYNYASGRLDHQVYYKSIAVDQYSLATSILDRIFSAWLAEAQLVTPELFANLEPFTKLPDHRWFWDGPQHVDPEKVANARETELRSGTTTLEEIAAANGDDWRAKARQQAIERSYYAELGIPYPGDVPKPTQAMPARNQQPSGQGGDNADSEDN